MKHAYYMSRDLDELEQVQGELASEGLKEDHVHVLSDDIASVEEHDMRPVNPFMRTDVIHSMSIGLAIGVIGALAVASTSWVFGINSPVGTALVIFGCLLVLGFSTWEGGLWGIQEANHKYARVEDEIHAGKHLLIVDYENQQEFQALRKVQQRHPAVESLQL